MTKEIEKEIENASKIIEFDSKDLRDALESQKQELLEKIIWMKKEYMRAVVDHKHDLEVDGYNQALEDIKKLLT